MPPLPPSSSEEVGVVVGVVGVVAVVSVVVGAVVGSVVEPAVVELVVSVDSEVASEVVEVELPLSPPEITRIAITRPTITATRPATTSRRFPWGPCPSSGWPIIRVGSSCISLLLGSEYRVEDPARVLDVEAVSQPHLDFLPAGARDRHLRRQQAGRGRAGMLSGLLLRGGRLGLDRPQARLGDRGVAVALEQLSRLPQALGHDQVGAGLGLLEISAGLL